MSSSDPYTLESQNNDSLAALSAKVSAIRSHTINIYDQARDHTLVDANNDAFSSLSQNIRGSAGRLTRMAQSGNKVAILKLSGMIVGAVIVLWWVGGWLFGGGAKEGV